MRYTIEEVVGVCGGRLLGGEPGGRVVCSVFTDSRSMPACADAMFIAIEGVNHDGHTYINELYGRGVRMFMVERDVATGKYPDACFIAVPGSVDALQRLAADYRAQFRGTVVGITGSNGKTVVKEWIAGLVPPGTKLFRSPKSYNSQIGVPLSVLMIGGDETVAVIEAGISQPGEMERLHRIIRPDVGVITTIGDAHQENFGSTVEKLEEKLGLFEGARTIVYNNDYPEIGKALARRFPRAKVVDACGCEGEVREMFSDDASRQNAAMAVAVCDVLGYDHGQTLSRLPGLQPVAMRLELKEGINGSIIVNDSYNSDINSLAIALDYLRSVAGGRPQTLVLSDILQSGYPQEELYGRVAQMVNLSEVDAMVGIGSRISRYPQLFGIRADFYPDVETYLRNVRRDDIAGRAILLKGNRRTRFERLSHAFEHKSHTTTLEVDLDAMVGNLNAYRAMLSPGTRVMAMIKASGYGHGGYEVASTLQFQGVDYLAVAFADEGVALRGSGIAMPIVVLNADEDSFELMVANGLEPEIYNFRSLAAFGQVLRRYGERSYPVHVKLDTGMHRLGFPEGDVERLAQELAARHPMLRVASIFSHFACADDPAGDGFTRAQTEAFRRMSGRLTEALGYKPLLHISNSAGAARFPEAEFDMVRLGIGLYGIGEVPGLRETAALHTRIVQIREVQPGECVGYGCAGRIERPTRLATIPVGYADGIDRRLGEGRWSVVVGGRPAPTVGRICMDTCMVDITGCDAAEGDDVAVFGGGEGNSIADMARALDTIPYEIMTSISARVKRIYTKE